jgi:hypothetical protein
MMQAYAAKDIIASIHMNDSIPSPQNILNIPFECYLPSEIDLRSEITLMNTFVKYMYFKVLLKILYKIYKCSVITLIHSLFCEDSLE